MIKVSGKKKTMDNQPKTRAEKGKGKGAKTKDAFNQKTVRQKTANMERASERDKLKKK